MKEYIYKKHIRINEIPLYRIYLHEFVKNPIQKCLEINRSNPFLLLEVDL